MLFVNADVATTPTTAIVTVASDTFIYVPMFSGFTLQVSGPTAWCGTYTAVASNDCTASLLTLGKFLLDAAQMSNFQALAIAQGLTVTNVMSNSDVFISGKLADRYWFDLSHNNLVYSENTGAIYFSVKWTDPNKGVIATVTSTSPNPPTPDPPDNPNPEPSGSGVEIDYEKLTKALTEALNAVFGDIDTNSE